MATENPDLTSVLLYALLGLGAAIFPYLLFATLLALYDTAEAIGRALEPLMWRIFRKFDG